MRRLFQYTLLALVALASPAFAQTVGAPVPSKAVVSGARDSAGTLVGVKVCDKFAPFDINFGASGTSAILTPTAGKKIFTCGFYYTSSAQVGVNWSESLSDPCAAGGELTGPATSAPNSGVVMSLSPYALPFTKTAGYLVCLRVSGPTRVSGWISYMEQ